MKKSVALCLFFFSLAPAGLMAQPLNMFIKITDELVIQGESTAPGHVNEIEALAESEGTSSPCTVSGTCSAASQSSFSFIMAMNKSVIPLRTALLTHNSLTSIDIVFQPATGTAYENFKIHLEEVFVESIQQSGSTGGDKPSYSVSFNAKKWRWTYIKAAGDTPIVYGWNFETNTAF